MKLLLDKGAAVDEQNENGKTALMLAKDYGHTEVVQLLEKTTNGLLMANGRRATTTYI